MAKTELKATVYRVVIYTNSCNLGQLVTVYSDHPEETIGHYLKRMGMKVVEEPVAVTTIAADHKAIDTTLLEHKEAPYFLVKNRLSQSPLERMLVD